MSGGCEWLCWCWKLYVGNCLFSFGLCSLAGDCGCVSTVSPQLACKGRVHEGFGGSGGASQWVAVQKVVLSAHSQVQWFALAILCSCTCATPSLWPGLEKEYQYFSSVPYSVLLTSLCLRINDLSWNHSSSYRKTSGLDLNFLMCRVPIIMSVSFSDCYLS